VLVINSQPKLSNNSKNKLISLHDNRILNSNTSGNKKQRAIESKYLDNIFRKDAAVDDINLALN
jgi:hypothetical protein